MATYKAVHDAGLWSIPFPYGPPLSSSTSIEKLPVMQNAALRNCHMMHTRHKTYKHLHDENTHTSHTRAPTASRVHITIRKTQHQSHPRHKTHNILQHSKAQKPTIFKHSPLQTA